MSRAIRLLLSLSIILSGLVLSLTTSLALPAQKFGWQIFQGAYEAVSWSAPIPADGGSVSLPATSGAIKQLIFQSGSFSEPATFNYDGQPADTEVGVDNLIGVGVFFEMGATDSSGNPLQPTNSFTITVEYDDTALPTGVSETSLALYRQVTAGSWEKSPGSTVDPNLNQISASPTSFSLWAVLTDTQQQVYLPVILRD